MCIKLKITLFITLSEKNDLCTHGVEELQWYQSFNCLSFSYFQFSIICSIGFVCVHLYFLTAHAQNLAVPMENPLIDYI